MEAGLVSIVLPIYNVEKYLDRCIESVVRQTYRNLEIILVDDGSPDGCPQKCEEWAKRDKRIKVIHKNNAGLGYARNTGIENASGEYICFFDSDDYIALDAIEKAYSLATKEKSDIVVFGFCNVKSNGETGKAVIPKTEKVTYSGDEVQDVFLADLIGPDAKNGTQTNLWMSAWTSMYSLDVIRKASWEFVSEREIISEDIYSLLKLYKHINRVSVLSDALYFYCENTDSLTHTYKADRFERIKNLYRECLNVCDELQYGSNVKKRFTGPFISNTIAAMKMIVIADLDKKQRIEILKRIIDDNLLQKVVHAIPLNKEKRSKKLFLIAIKGKRYLLCYCLLRVKVGKIRGQKK